MATTVLGLKTFTASDPVDYNEVNDNYNKIDNGVKTALQGRAAHNLLDNSDFRNTVNQRGKTSYSAAGYNIDRWHTNMVENATLTVGSGKITISKTATGGSFQQTLPFDMTGKTMTYAVKTANGVTCKSAVISSSSSFAQIDGVNAYLGVFVDNGQTFFQIYFNDSSSITLDLYWAALYEGSYTADTLPAYQPKGFAEELAECRRYYKKYSTCQFPITITTAAWAAAAIDYTDMRGTPTIIYDLAGLYVADNVYTSITSITARTLPASELVINTGVSVAANKTGTIRFNSLALSYDL